MPGSRPAPQFPYPRGTGDPHVHLFKDLPELVKTASANGSALVADSTKPGGVKWAAPTPAAHTHVESDVTSLVTDLAGKAATVHTHAEADVTSLVTDLAGKAATVHTHAESDVTNLTTDLAALPKGHQNSVSSTATVTGVGATSTAFSGLGSCAFTAVTGRRYLVTVKAAFAQSTATAVTILDVRDGGASTPTNTSTSVDLARICSGNAAGTSTGYSFELSGLSAGTHTLGLFGHISTGTVILGDAAMTSYLIIEDIGT